jgi:hypothetical protein
MYAEVGQQAKLPGIKAHIAMSTMHAICSASLSTFNFALISWVSLQGPTPDTQTKAIAVLSPHPALQATNVIIAAQSLVNKPACSVHTNELHVLPLT